MSGPSVSARPGSIPTLRELQVLRAWRDSNGSARATALYLGITEDGVDAALANVRSRAGVTRTWQALHYLPDEPMGDVPPAPARPEQNKRALSPALRFAVLERDGFRCRYCGRTAADVSIQVDHVVPRSMGGSDDPDNLTAACDDCNLGKSNRMIVAPLG